MSSDQIDFATWCIGNLSRRLGISQRDLFNMLDESGILFGYIVPAYDSLHTFGKDYIMDDISGLMRERGVLV